MLLPPSSVVGDAPKVRLKCSPLKQCVLSVLHRALAAEVGRGG